MDTKHLTYFHPGLKLEEDLFLDWNNPTADLPLPPSYWSHPESYHLHCHTVWYVAVVPAPEESSISHQQNDEMSAALVLLLSWCNHRRWYFGSSSTTFHISSLPSWLWHTSVEVEILHGCLWSFSPYNIFLLLSAPSSSQTLWQKSTSNSRGLLCNDS